MPPNGIVSLLLLLSLIQGTHGFSGLGSARPVDRGDAAGVDAHDGAAPFAISPTPTEGRRPFLSRFASASIAVGAFGPTREARASFWAPDRRQLELCLVAVLRTQYWAMKTAGLLQSRLLTAATDDNSTDPDAGPPMSENQRRLPYLEARLGAKALLTQKIGGGATEKVVTLGTFQLRECLADAGYWCEELAKTAGTKDARRLCRNDLADTAEELVEALASLVEFDGLETTIDPSPRSSLMLGMYTPQKVSAAKGKKRGYRKWYYSSVISPTCRISPPQKGAFVYRTLNERVIPNCERYLKFFGRERMRVVEEFVQNNYASEVPFEVLERLYNAS